MLRGCTRNSRQSDNTFHRLGALSVPSSKPPERPFLKTSQH